MFENTYPPGLAPLGHPLLGKGGAFGSPAHGAFVRAADG